MPETIEGEFVDVTDRYGDDDFAPVMGGRVEQVANPQTSLAEMVRSSDLSLAQAAFIAAPAVYGYSVGRTLGERIMGAAVGGLVGAIAFEVANTQGWVE